MNGTLLSCIVESVNTRRDSTIKIVLGCQEMSPSKTAEIIGMMNKIAAVYISQKETISAREMEQIDQVNPDFENGKTQSQRIRGVLFRLWEQKPEGFKDFDSFYRNKTEKIIEHYKKQLDQ